VVAETAAFTGYRIDLEITDSMEMAQVLTETAPGAKALIDYSDLSAPELVLFFHTGTEQEMKISGIDITIGQNLALSDGRKGADDACLPCSAFATQNHYLFHFNS
jgi:hypothetical protein